MADSSAGQANLVELLGAEFTILVDLGASLSPSEWHRSVVLPGWSVFDVYAHIIGTESMLDGVELPGVKPDVASFDHVRNEIGVFNETWAEALSGHGPEAMLERLRAVTQRRRAALAAMSPEAWNAETVTPVGPAPYWRFMQIRLFDCWMHEQDVREALTRPGNESGRIAEAAVDELIRALGYVVGKQAAAPPGSSITFELTGPVYRTVHLVVDDRAEVVDELPGPATTVVRLSSSLLMRLAGGRAAQIANRHGGLSFEGDLNVAQKIARNLSFTI